VKPRRPPDRRSPQEAERRHEGALEAEEGGHPVTADEKRAASLWWFRNNPVVRRLLSRPRPAHWASPSAAMTAHWASPASAGHRQAIAAANARRTARRC
jgi:hypothetical protein